jgi:hypothetical protein
MRGYRDVAAAGAAALMATGLVACGSGGADGPQKAKPTAAQDQAAVRGALVELEKATAAHDYATLCTRVLARELVQKVAGAGLPCETALSVGLKGVKQPHLQVSQIKVTGNHALAQVYSGATGQKNSTDVVQLVRERGSWRVTSLAGPQPPAPKGRDDS